jgi:hypothetical protein
MIDNQVDGFRAIRDGDEVAAVATRYAATNHFDHPAAEFFVHHARFSPVKLDALVPVQWPAAAIRERQNLQRLGFERGDVVAFIIGSNDQDGLG